MWKRKNGAPNHLVLCIKQLVNGAVMPKRPHQESNFTRDQTMNKALRLFITDWACIGGLNTFCSHICGHGKTIHTSPPREDVDFL